LESFEGKVCLSVRDTGVGIPEKELPRVFERFHRVENSHGRSFEGSGIGLALIQEFVKLHKGTIAVQSTLNKGTCFTVTIPYGYAHLPAAKVMKAVDYVATDGNKRTMSSREASTPVTATVKENQQVDAAENSVPNVVEQFQLFVDEIKQWQDPKVNFHRPLPSANISRVLLVDDNVDMRSYIGNILKRFWEVELAVDGLQALESALRSPPDLILTDIMMPKIDGLELIKRLRNDPRTKGVPIILLSARAGDQAKVEGLDVGADDYIIKTSFSEKELLARVRNHLELGRLRRHLEKEVIIRTEELFELNSALYEFIDMICHEVRNPLHGIVGNCELLKEAVTNLLDFKSEITPPMDSLTTQGLDLKKYLSNIEECVHHQTTMLDEVILLTKLDAKKIEFVNIVCEPSKFLSGVMHNFKSKINSKGIKIVLNPVKEGSKIMTDPRCVNQILNGLLANVIENSAVGSEIAVSQSLKIEDNRLKLESNLVCTSVDIDEKTFSALINTFSQINVGVGQNYAKSRFSLAISNKLVGLMGGDKISITKEGTGETGFTFTVVCQKAEELFSVIDVPRQAEPVVTIAKSPYLPTKRALIVEDNHINQTLCKALLRKLGFDSEIANNGQEAVEMFKPSHFDFILMDVAMPIMDGIQATYEIRQIEANLKAVQPVVIIGLSAYSQEEKINKASEAGMNDYISKPATFNKIVNIISQWTKPNPLRKTKSELLLQNSIVPKSEAVALSMLSKPKTPSLL
jgi:CheY-like chemotaxis protein